MGFLYIIAVGKEWLDSIRIAEVNRELRNARDYYSDVLESTAALHHAIARLGRAQSDYHEKNLSKLRADLTETVDELRKRHDDLLPGNTRVRNTYTVTMFSAYDLLARVEFLERRYKNIKEIGEMLIELDRRQWDGYHYSGIAIMGDDSYDMLNNADHRQKAIAYFKKSVELRRRSNRDRNNLAELALLDGDYSLMAQEAREYIDTSSPNSRMITAEFFLVLSRYLSAVKSNPKNYRDAFAIFLRDRAEFYNKIGISEHENDMRSQGERKIGVYEPHLEILKQTYDGKLVRCYIEYYLDPTEWCSQLSQSEKADLLSKTNEVRNWCLEYLEIADPKGEHACPGGR